MAKIPAAQRLAVALLEAGAPRLLVERARRGYYGDFTSPLATPITKLVADLNAEGLGELAVRAANGEFDGA